MKRFFIVLFFVLLSVFSFAQGGSTLTATPNNADSSWSIYALFSPTNVNGNRWNILHFRKNQSTLNIRVKSIQYDSIMVGRNDTMAKYMTGFDAAGNIKAWDRDNSAFNISQIRGLNSELSTKITQSQADSRYLQSQVNADWNSTSGSSQILNKPNLFSGSYLDLTNKPVIPAAQVNSDWNSVNGASQILNKPVLFSGAYNDLTGKPILFSGDYNDLANKPSIPQSQVNSDWNATSGVSLILNKPVLFSGAYSDLSGKPIIPSNTNQLVNGANFITAADVNNTTVLAAIGYIPYNGTTNPNNYITSAAINNSSVVAALGATPIFVETDPNIPAYAKTLSAFSVIKSSTDVLYKPIGYTPSFSEITCKPTTLNGYGIIDAYPLTGNPSGFLTSVTNITGNAGTATKLQTARTINGVSFDGTSNILITASTSISAPVSGTAIVMGTAFQPRVAGPCHIVVNCSLSGVVGLNETITVAMSATSGGTYTTVATDVLLISALGVNLDRSIASIPVPTGWWVRVTRTGTAASANYTVWNL